MSVVLTEHGPFGVTPAFVGDAGESGPFLLGRIGVEVKFDGDGHVDVVLREVGPQLRGSLADGVALSERPVSWTYRPVAKLARLDTHNEIEQYGVVNGVLLSASRSNAGV